MLITVLSYGAAFAVGVVFSYLFLRANLNKKRAVDEFADKQG